MTGQTELRDSNASVVVMGSFNPLIFQPDWLKDNGIIGIKEAETARETGIEVIHRELVVLNLSSSLRLEVYVNRFMVLSREAPTVVARDFALKCFRLLSHTPVVQVGLNFGTVFRANSREAWDAFGDALAPKGPWKTFLGDDMTKRPGGLMAMHMQKTKRANEMSGVQNVQIGVPNIPNRETQVDFNDHYELVGATTSEKMELLIKILEECWDSAEKEAVAITTSLRELCRAD
jgi:hypothetical protein